MSAPDIGRPSVRHLMDLMHKTTDEVGDPIPAGYLPVADGLGNVDYVDSATIGGAGSLATLSDVTLTGLAADDVLQYNGSLWVNSSRRWEPVTFDPGTGPEIVFTATDIVMTWETY